ncbi:hypothetical protein JF535_00400 [Microbulbifer salipaludis]|uniref:Conjugal transfer protein TrbL n=1 Tax=Microbulbifer salipaludis TaxID=187980 RepID=A0ABS3E1Y8_9GAMM|nr:hypothetical protein [Microbulbifer salipaludis]
MIGFEHAVDWAGIASQAVDGFNQGLGMIAFATLLLAKLCEIVENLALAASGENGAALAAGAPGLEGVGLLV